MDRCPGLCTNAALLLSLGTAQVPAPPPQTPREDVTVVAPLAATSRASGPLAATPDGVRLAFDEGWIEFAVDVPEGSTHAYAISCIGGYEITLGYGDGRYGPANGLSRAQTATSGASR